MSDVLRYIGQGLAYALMALLIGALASWPRLAEWPAEAAQIKLSFVHGAQRKVECRRLSSEEIAKLPPSQRRPNTCGRERLDLLVQLEIDGQLIYDEVLPPTGIARDGPARVYKKFRVSAGKHAIVARLRDSSRREGVDFEQKAEVTLAPEQSLAIDFMADRGTFVFR
ncbi:MAG: hypothetical protein F9K44_03360 [Hyphomicrobiaceae bacterium]|nr:MAG: hypothetical protein F9K44_03360 [Hyphomicrobiaceae bacterium]